MVKEGPPVKLSKMLPKARSRVIETNAGLGLGPWKLYQTIKYTGIFSSKLSHKVSALLQFFISTYRKTTNTVLQKSEVFFLDYFADIYCSILARGLGFTWGPRPLANMTFLKRVSFCFYEYLLLKF